MKRQRPPFSILALIAANLAPLFGVLFFGWDAAAIVLLYWIENLIIGAYNVLMMILVKVKSQSEQFKNYLLFPFSACTSAAFVRCMVFFYLPFLSWAAIWTPSRHKVHGWVRLYLYSSWSPLSHSSGKVDRPGWNGRFYVLL